MAMRIPGSADKHNVTYNHDTAGPHQEGDNSHGADGRIAQGRHEHRPRQHPGRSSTYNAWVNACSAVRANEIKLHTDHPT